MGGSSSKTTPIQTPQSKTAFTGATAGASNLAGLGNQYSGQQQQLFNMLWGTPGTPGAPSAGGPSGGTTTGGALGNFLNPANLNVTSPTGPFAGAFTNDKTQLAKTAAQNAEDIKSQAAQSGFGANSPSGMTADQLRANNSDLANNVGKAFTTETGNSYQAALNNFWNAANAAQTGAATAQSGALQGTGNAADIYENLYGPSLGKETQNNAGVMGVLGPILGAAGTIGGAAMGGPAGAAMLGKGSGGVPGPPNPITGGAPSIIGNLQTPAALGGK